MPSFPSSVSKDPSGAEVLRRIDACPQICTSCYKLKWGNCSYINKIRGLAFPVIISISLLHPHLVFSVFFSLRCTDMGPTALSSFWPLAVCVARVKKTPPKKIGLITEKKNNLARHRATIFNIQDKNRKFAKPKHRPNSQTEVSGAEGTGGWSLRHPSVTTLD